MHAKDDRQQLATAPVDFQSFGVLSAALVAKHQTLVQFLREVVPLERLAVKHDRAVEILLRLQAIADSTDHAMKLAAQPVT